ncbi:MAG: nucleotidyltransferase family protein [Gemmatimonadales bacterium]
MASARAPSGAASAAPLANTLLEQLARSLEQHGVRYCQWKGHWSAHRWATGHGDVDLLVDHEALVPFHRIAEELGFKLAHPAAGREIAGIESYLGHDPQIDRLLHLHVHYRLLLGDYWRPVYRLPIEGHLLRRTVQGSVFRVPSPTDQYLVFVLRMMLRQVGRPLLSARTVWTSGIRIQLAALGAASDRRELASVLREHLRPVDLPFFDRCVRSLEGECSLVERAVLPWQLHRSLRPLARPTPAMALIPAAVEKIFPESIAHKLCERRKRLAGGGLVLALSGGDGAGKSTCARELAGWLAPAFPTMRAHLGKPPRSLITLIAGGALRLQHWLDRQLSRPSRPNSATELLRHVCTARDRFLLYQKVRRFAVSGGISVCERYPVLQNRKLVGPCISELLPANPSRLAKLLRQAEASYYDRILLPDALVVLRLDPELAVLRNPEQPADRVRARARVIWEADWSAAGASVVDASLPLEEVIGRLKAIVWSLL